MRDDVRAALLAAGYRDRRRAHGALPRLDHRLDERRRQAQAARVRHRGAERARRRCTAASASRSAWPSSARAATRSTPASSPASGRPRARRSTSAAAASSRSTSSRCCRCAAEPRVHRRARFHELEVAEVRPLTADSVEVSFTVPPELHDDYDYLAGQYVALRKHDRRARVAAQLLDLPATAALHGRRRADQRRHQARHRRPVLDLGQQRTAARRPDRRDEPAGHVHDRVCPISTEPTSSASPRAPGSRR